MMYYKSQILHLARNPIFHSKIKSITSSDCSGINTIEKNVIIDVNYTFSVGAFDLEMVNIFKGDLQ